MPRSFGITNAAPYAAAPAVGNAGDMYWNTTNKTLYLSDGAVWNPIQGGGGSGSGLVWTIKTLSANAVLNDGDMALVDCSTGNVTITIAPTAGAEYTVKRIDASTNNLLVVPNTGNIDGDPNASLVGQWTSAIFVGDGTNLHVAAVEGVVSSAPYNPVVPQVEAFVSTNTNVLGASTWVTVLGWGFDTANFPNTGYIYTGGFAAGVLTFTQAGIYIVSGQVASTAASAVTRQVRLMQSPGGELNRNSVSSVSGLTVQPLAGPVQANVGDQLYWAMYGAAGGISFDSSVGHKWQIVRIA